MPNIKSAVKRVKVNKAKALNNKARKSNLKTVIKKANLAEGDDKVTAVRLAIKKVDRLLLTVLCTRTVLQERKLSSQKCSTLN